jgi:hypothetical protein
MHFDASSTAWLSTKRDHTIIKTLTKVAVAYHAHSLHSAYFLLHAVLAYCHLLDPDPTSARGTLGAQRVTRASHSRRACRALLQQPPNGIAHC